MIAASILVTWGVVTMARSGGNQVAVIIGATLAMIGLLRIAATPAIGRGINNRRDLRRWMRRRNIGRRARRHYRR